MDSDGIITFRDLNAPANASYFTDVNGTGYIDGGDLLNDARWENGLDDDGNTKVDDLAGWDFYDNDNDPEYFNANFHGLEMAQRLAATGNDGFGWVGVMWNARLMNVRMMQSAPDRRDNAAALDYAVAEGATISNNCYGDYTYSQEMYDAIDRARLAGHLFVAAALNGTKDIDVEPAYPASYDLDNVISVAALTSSDQLTSVTNWGQANVDLGSPSDTGATSKATPLVTGVAGLLRTLHPDWTYAQIKNQILSTVDPLSSLAGKSVTGGRLNAANALGYVPPETKFYVVDDASANRTFEYAADGSTVENYAVASGNSAPRGAASNAAGTKVWVVDVNRNVYVYDPRGMLLGSWSVGGFNNSAQLEGIATNGTDIWIVDNKSDKVYRYTGAASRTSGTQSAASSFNLNSSNKDATDLVADGTSIWVLNNSATDKVFKYTLSGSLLGSWTITSAGGSPTGITLDPSSPSHLWIVDSSSDRIYQFDTATTRTSGSQSPSSFFALASGNTNPQGLADPPIVGRAGHRGEALVADRPAPQVDSASGAAHHDLALLSLIQDLDNLLPTDKRRR